MARPRSPWTVVMLSYPCPVCGAAPGDKCVTTSGRTKSSDVHAERTRPLLTNRCPKCGALTPADDEPGQLCARCELVRALEVERATTWKRNHP